MDADRFDSLTRTLTAPLSRRVTLRGLAAGVLLAFGLALDESTVLAKKKNKDKGNKKNNNKGNKKNKKTNCPQERRCGNQCCPVGQTCRGGECRCSFDRSPCGNECCTLGETCVDNQCKHHCEDGQRNAGETDRDCGGTCLPGKKCDRLRLCGDDADCLSGVCFDFRPGERRCGDCRIDTDCAFSPLGPRCINNRCHDCADDRDCPAPGDSPEKKFCVAPPGTCPNNEPCVCRECRQLPEVDDCQDSGKRVCVAGTCKECGDDVDCDDGELCDESGSCVPCASTQGQGGQVHAAQCIDPCLNGFKDGNETDIDCGGPACSPCARGQSCQANRDCSQELICHQGVCRPACSPDTTVCGQDDLCCSLTCCEFADSQGDPQAICCLQTPEVCAPELGRCCFSCGDGVPCCERGSDGQIIGGSCIDGACCMNGCGVGTPDAICCADGMICCDRTGSAEFNDLVCRATVDECLEP